MMSAVGGLGVSELLLLVAILAVFAVIGIAGLALAALMIHQSVKRKGKMGINVRREDCPRCGATLPMIRTPTSVSQALWGGWTCRGCGAELDKWGRIKEGSHGS